MPYNYPEVKNGKFSRAQKKNMCLTLGDLVICGEKKKSAIALVTEQDGLQEVSRGHSSPFEKKKG